MYTDQGEEIGTIREILATGANDVWVVKRKEGKDLLIPYIEEIVTEINIDEKKVIITPMEGLLD
jgi:16S rRNA processing protein RimM